MPHALPSGGKRQGLTLALLKQLGLEFHRQAAGSHEIWCNPALNRYTTIPNHPGDMPEGTLRAILKSSPLPKPDSPGVFERELKLTFRPKD